MRIKLLSVLLLSLWATLQFPAQHVLSRNYSLKDGLPSTETYQVITDHAGFIWISSDAGLCRFNGYSFRTFTVKDGLPETTIFKLYEDPKGRIWFTTLSSNVGFVYHDSVVLLPKIKAGLGQINKQVPFVSSIHVDGKDTLWIGTLGTGRLLKVNSPYINQTPVVVFDKQDYLIRFIEKGHQETAYGVTWNAKPHVNLLEVEKSEKGYYFKEHLLSLGDSTNAKLFLWHPKGFFLFVKGNKVYTLQRDTLKLVLTLKGEAISCFVDNHGYVWVSEPAHGIYCLPNLPYSNKTIHLFGETNISSGTIDFEGCYWFTTLERGLLYMPRLDFTVIGTDEGLVQKRINSIEICSKEKLFAQSYSGNLYLSDGRKITTVPTGALSVFQSPNFPGKLFYTGVYPGYISLMDYKMHPVTGSDGLKWYINHFATAPNGELYASYTSYLLRFDKELKAHRFLEIKERVNTFYIDRESVFWIGTTNGMIRFESGKLQEHLGKENILLSKRIDRIAEDLNGRLWLATRGNGLLIYDKRKDIKVLDKQSGLPSDFCRAILIDSLNTIWLGTNSGLSSINGNTLKITNYDLLNELSSGEINDIKRIGNYLWVACSEGVFRYAIDQLESLSQNPPIFITSVSTQGKGILKENATLDYDQNFIKISFLGLSYYEAGKLNYDYKLEGADKEWRHTNSLVVEYPTLPPGNYCFTVKPQVGVQSKPHVAQFRFKITPPFWKTNSFIGLLSLLIITCTIAIFIFSIRRVQRKAKARINVANLEATALRAQMNPHFIFNAINSIQNFILKNEKRPALDFLTKFSRLIRNVLEFSKSDFISLHDEVQTLDLYLQLEKLRASDKFDFRINVGSSISGHCLIPSMVLQPFIENAVLHGLLPKVDGPGYLLVNFDRTGEQLNCVIEDNGIGREKAAEIKGKKQNYHRSMGMSVTSGRLDILREVNQFEASCFTEDLFDKDHLASGTRVTLTFPITYPHGSKHGEKS